MENEKIKITARCPIRTTMELIGGKWKLLILNQLKDKVLRTSELAKLIPDISEKMLIQELKTLVESQLVLRKQYEEVPPRVEYQLSEQGQLVFPLLEEMVVFAKKYEAALVKNNTALSKVKS